MDNTKKYTAADIDKYHKGLLSTKEMHDLEKAALDDPFLADALEGYTTEGVNMTADITDLNERLSKRIDTADTKVIPIAGGKSSFPFLRVAAAVVILLGAGLLTYKFAFNTKQETGIAKVEPAKSNEKVSDTAGNTTVNTETTPVNTNPAQGTTTATQSNGRASINSSTQTITATDRKANITPADKGSGKSEVVDNKVTESPPVVVNDEVTKRELKNDSEKQPANQADFAKTKAANYDSFALSDKDVAANSQYKKIAANNNSGYMAPAAGKSRRSDDQSYRNQVIFNFRGRVTDDRNVGVPFANVTNIQDNNAGTYTDANGYFNLTYPDTVLTVQVHSIGFENNNVQLKNSLLSNKVVMQEDRKSLSEVVLGKKQTNSTIRNRDINKKLEEPEPADGWENYDAYLANNLNMPEDIENKPSATPTVEVSFEVDKNGEPVNIKVEKSLCSKCDVEAIRLIKDGPKWKRKAKKNGRTTVTISF